MKNRICVYGDARAETLVAFLYGEMEPKDRALFEQHLSGCALCRGEVDELSGLRAQLGRWAMPDQLAHPAGNVRGLLSSTPRRWAWGHELPAWARVAAASLFIGAALGAANINVTVTPDGWSVRTGWLTGQPVIVEENTPAAGRQASLSAWQPDLAALEQRLREDVDARTAALRSGFDAGKAADDEAIRQLRAIVQDSERRQQRELALRVAEVAREMQGQRQADLVRIDRSLGIIQNRTGMEVMRQQQLLNNLLRVSQKQ